MRYKIKPEERGHRKPLSKTEKTVKHTLYLTESQRVIAKQKGQKWYRDIINKEQK